MTAPHRIVSLVPSLTETVASWGLIDRLVGRTRYCVEPAGEIEAVEELGGTKNPDVGRIIALQPDLVIVNKEENRIEDWRHLQAAGLMIHVTHPRSLEQALTMLEELGVVLGARAAADRLVADCRLALDHCRGGEGRRRVFCPIWKKPWMTFGRHTYIGDMLAVAGYDNVFGDDRGEDFFEVTLDEILARAPEAVVLPDEPFVFEARHADELRLAGLAGAEFLFVDGRNLSWYGPRIPAALDALKVKGATSGG